MWFDVCVVSSLAACVAPNWGVASLRRVLCGWPALVGWRASRLFAFGGFLLWVRITSACPTIASLCNKTIASLCNQGTVAETTGMAYNEYHSQGMSRN